MKDEETIKNIINSLLIYPNNIKTVKIKENKNEDLNIFFQNKLKELKYIIPGDKFIIFSKEFNNDNNIKTTHFLMKIIYFSYRNNFNPISNNNKFRLTYTSDTGWGCMIRCGQMIMSRGLYKYLKKNNNLSSFKAIKETIKYFLDLPYLNEELPCSFEKMKKILNDSKIIYAPFSFNNLSLFGNLCNKFPGEWFSDVNMSYLFNKISFVFNLFDNLEILNFQTGFYLSGLLEKCFNVLEDKNHQISNFYEFNDKKYEFKKSGIVFISVRIGIDFISKEYYENIRYLFKCKQCLGIIGGRTNSAYYFIGYNNEGNLLYLDPHITNDSVLDFDNESIYHNYLNKNIKSMNISNMSTAFTVGFIFRNIDEFKLLINYLIQYVSKDFSCFWVSTKNKEDINKNLDNLKEYIDNDEDDF
jgi:cysteine protease ATG4